MNPIIGIVILAIMVVSVFAANIALIIYAKRKQRWERITSYYKEEK